MVTHRQSNMSGATNQSKIYRNLRENQRRIHLKDLFARLTSLLPHQSSRRISLLDSFDQAINHIRQSQERIMTLSKRLEQLRRKADNNNLPEISVTSFGNDMEVNFRVSEWNKSISLQEAIHAIGEEGGEIISLNYSIVGGQLPRTIRFKAINARIGIEISNVKERLRQLSLRHN